MLRRWQPARHRDEAEEFYCGSKVHDMAVEVGRETSGHEVCPLRSAPVRLHPMRKPSNCTFWQSPSWRSAF